MAEQTHRSGREAWKVALPAIGLVIFGFWVAYQFVQPAPPKHIRMATGSADGAYHKFARQYVAHLAAEGIELELVPSSGTLDNIAMLHRGEVDIAFVQSGVAADTEDKPLWSLGSLFLEPLWVFVHDSQEVALLRDFQGLRIAVGAEGSGTRPLALELLAANGIDHSNALLLDMGGDAAADRLTAGEIDAAIFVASPQADYVVHLNKTQTVRLFGFKRAAAYARLYPHLSSVVVPQGLIDLARNLPDADVELIAASANLVTTEEFHPALIDLILQTARRVHGSAGWFSDGGQFPSPDFLAFPLLKEAERFYEYGPPFLQRYLPFWAATLIDRLKVMLLPLLVLLIPLFKTLPPIYRWRIRSRIYCWYRDILAVEKQFREAGEATPQMWKELEMIDDEVRRIAVPLSYADELYDLRLHIELVRESMQTPS
ncbi:ABC transporter substrate-binding protein [Geoalkalibacter halelectricus]|uniref:ABC transporter substrate-binding protein n=1 Tax=Geoalkalibacter halelectricus TaxID=2847045 RepID=A0ABY5ZI28_9BACT|nr:TAXI family TRAP transporter solute-binding subunit [Geoalkalibacter halelectricus]UWZ78104.1 ABC transporter substrate-binding protein [Geoalkalibacter halelectricus]